MKELPVLFPLISTYPEYGHLFSILDVTDTNVEAWIISNFINVVGYEYRFFHFRDTWTLLKRCPFIQCNSIDRGFVKYIWRKSAISLFVSIVDSGCYIIIDLDRFYISNSPEYQRHHINHKTLIYGYDANKKIFNVADNLENGKYVRFEYSFADVELSYSLMESIGNNDGYDVFYLKSFDCKNYKFDICYLLRELELYVSQNSLNVEWGYAYNLDAITYFAEQIENTACGDNEKMNIDLRPACLFIDQKDIMSLRIQYLCRKNYIGKGEELLKKNKAIRQRYVSVLNSLMKYNVTKNTQILWIVIDSLHDLRTLDNAFFNDLILQIHECEAVKRLIGAKKFTW